MFKAKLMGCRSGLSKKTNKNFYVIDLYCDTISGGKHFQQFFVDSLVFNDVKGLAPETPLKVQCGVNDNGYLTISAISADK